MLSASWARAAASLALFTLIVGACSDSSDGDGSAGSAGTSQGSGDGGAGGSGASQGAAGDGGHDADPCAAEPDSEACHEVPWCGPFAITEVCGPTPFPLCPAGLADFVERTPCDSVTSLEAYDTSCGGRVLIRSYATRTESWEFDGDDVLVSVVVEADTLHTCFEGGRSLSWLYGSEPCAIDPDSKVDECASLGGAGGASAGGAGSIEPVAVGGAGGAGGAP